MYAKNRIVTLKAGKQLIAVGEQKEAYDLGDKVLLVALPDHPIYLYHCLALRIANALFSNNFPHVFAYNAASHPDGFMVLGKIPTTPEYEACIRQTYGRYAYGGEFIASIDAPLAEKHRVWVESDIVKSSIDEICACGINVSTTPTNVIRNSTTNNPVFIEFCHDLATGEMPPFVGHSIREHILKTAKTKQAELLRLLEQYGATLIRDWHPISSDELSIAID